MAIDDIGLRIERVTLRTLLMTQIIFWFGIGLLYLSAREDWWEIHEAWQIVIQNAGGSLLVAGTITLLWELWGKRAFLDEVLAKAHISKEITSAGIVKINASFYYDVDWKSYFQTANELDIFFAYASTWRNIHRQKLQEVATKENARIRVVLPDPEDEQTVSELARRFKYTPDHLIYLIRDAETHFKSLRPSTGAKGAQIDIWFLPAAPLFTFYRFNHIGILVLYSHRQKQAHPAPTVPTFVCEKGGTLYDYIYEEFNAMTRPDGLARLVTKKEH